MAKPRKSDEEKLDDARIMKLFRGRCVLCTAPATVVHEIVLRSRTKFATTMPKNRVPLDETHHRWAHHDGATQDKADLLYNKAVERLIFFGVNLEDW